MSTKVTSTTFLVCVLTGSRSPRFSRRRVQPTIVGNAVEWGSQRIYESNSSLALLCRAVTLLRVWSRWTVQRRCCSKRYLQIESKWVSCPCYTKEQEKENLECIQHRLFRVCNQATNMYNQYVQPVCRSSRYSLISLLHRSRSRTDRNLNICLMFSNRTSFPKKKSTKKKISKPKKK